MRYEIDNNNYIVNVYFGCYGTNCKEYTGTIPESYETLALWAENEVVNAWKIENGNLVYDANRAAELERQCELDNLRNTPATQGYVNDKINQANDIIVDELSNTAESNSLIHLKDSGNYNVTSLKVFLDANNSKEIQLKVTNDNLIKNKVVSQTIAGVEITINEDKTMILNGTATEDINIILNGSDTNTDMLFLLKSNINYYQGGMVDNTNIILYNFDGTDRKTISNLSNGKIYLSNDEVVTEVVLYITNGTTFSNLKINPMLTISDTPKQYIAAQENELIKIDLNEFTIKNGDYLEIRDTSVYLVSGKDEEYLYSIEKPIQTFYPETYVMIDKSNTMSIEYFRDKYFVNTLNEMKSDLEGLSLMVTETFQAKNVVNAETIIKLENAFAPSNLLELRIKGEMQMLFPSDDLFPEDDLYPTETNLIVNQSEEITEDAKRYTIPLNYLHYMNENVFDEFILTPEESKIIRRVGVNENGTFYALNEETTEMHEGFEISMFEGDNYLHLETFKIDSLYFTATYEINKLNGNYATKSELELTKNSINAEVTKKVGNDEIIARINMAIQGIEEDEDGNIPEDVEKSIIEILANKISIKSDFTELTPEGHFTTTSAKIANWLLKDEMLYSNTDINGVIYQSGLDSRKNNFYYMLV